MYEFYRGLVHISYPVEDVSSTTLRLESQVEHLKDGASTEGQTATLYYSTPREKM